MNSNNSPQTTSTSMLVRLQRQEPEAWQYFEIVYMPYIKGFCRMLQLADREDIAHEVFLRVRKKIDDFKRQRNGSFRKWLRIITLNLIHDYCDAEKIPLPINDLERFTYPSPHETDKETLFFYEKLVAAAANKYSAKWLRSFLGMTVFGLTSVELATELDMSESAVRKANFKILHWLRTEFADLLED